MGSGDGPASRPSATSVPDRAGDRMDRGKSEGNMEVSLKEKDDMGDLMKNGGTCHGLIMINIKLGKKMEKEEEMMGQRSGW